MPSPPADRKFAAVSSGDSHACGLIAWAGGDVNHEVICWGATGLSRTDDWPSSAQIEKVSVGDNHNCVVRQYRSGGLRGVWYPRIACWGSNEANQRSDSAARDVSAGGGTYLLAAAKRYRRVPRERRVWSEHYAHGSRRRFRPGTLHIHRSKRRRRPHLRHKW